MKITGANHQRLLEFSNDLLPSIVDFDEGNLSLEARIVLHLNQIKRDVTSGDAHEA
ncbi:hypothetical protein [Xenorhabdus khoisanae]|uniref:hypothetical protein n=1 Tax=Xenorhabdus khoisanae TaxID=880157 RepID=UPI000A7B92C1|nr:hypothetical protein [Xenorhabdus khoisanae]